MRFFRKRQDESAPNFFQGLGENTSLQPTLKSNALGLESPIFIELHRCVNR